jgi:hypothetical protein
MLRADMRSRLALLLAATVSFSLVLHAACGGEVAQSPPQAPVTAIAALPAPTPSATASAVVAPPPSAEPGLTGPCKVLADDRQAEMERVKAISESKDPLGRSGAVSDEVRGAFVRCTMTKKGGAWGFALRDTKSEANGITAVMAAVYVDASGKKSELRLKGAGRLAERSFGANDLDRVSVAAEQGFDFDGDGEDELIAYGTNQTKEGPKLPLAWVLTVKDGVVQPYAPAAGIVFHRVEDVDHDGRPDLVTYGSYRASFPDRCSGEHSAIVGPALLAHSLKDGTFSMSDERAIAFAKQSCEKPGFEIARDDEKHVDDEQTAEAIVCARLWGMPAQQVIQKLDQCGFVSGPAACQPAAAKTCGNAAGMAILKGWANAKPPLTIR